MNEKLCLTIFWGIFVFLILLIVVNEYFKQMDYAYNSAFCCDGKQCSDTYYSVKDGMCHLSLCENSPFTNKEDCIYPAKEVNSSI